MHDGMVTIEGFESWKFASEELQDTECLVPEHWTQWLVLSQSMQNTLGNWMVQYEAPVEPVPFDGGWSQQSGTYSPLYPYQVNSGSTQVVHYTINLEQAPTSIPINFYTEQTGILGYVNTQAIAQIQLAEDKAMLEMIDQSAKMSEPVGLADLIKKDQEVSKLLNEALAADDNKIW